MTRERVVGRSFFSLEEIFVAKVPASFRIEEATRTRIDVLATLLKLDKGAVVDELVRFYLEKREQPLNDQMNSVRKLMAPPRRSEGRRAA